MESKSKRKPDELLMDAFGFDEDDLEANRAGKISARQRTALEGLYRYARYTNLNRSLLGIGFTAILLMGVLLLPYGFQYGFQDVLQSLLMPSMQAVLCVIGLPLLGLTALAVRDTFRQANPLFNDLKDGLVKQAEGRVRLDVIPPLQTGRTFKPPPLYIAIEDQGWRINRDTFLAFKNGDPYVIYYAPYSRTILSVEWLRDPMPTQTPADSADAIEITPDEKRKRSE
jgi:hypothetical protein